MRVCVVGAGVMGCATAWALTGRGAEVTLVEQFAPDAVRGSSHGRSRIVRLAYPDVVYVELAREAFAGWRELERQCGRTLLELNGLVEVAPDVALTSASALDDCGVPYRLLGRDEARELGAAIPPGWTALHQAEAGIVRADLARASFLELARARGAQVEWSRRIESLDAIDADAVVVTAGPWVRELVPDVPVEVTCETVAYFRLERVQPSVVDLDPDTRGHAMYALHDPVHGLKAGVHGSGRVADPRAEPSPEAELVARISAWVRERLPDADPAPVEPDTCFYTSTVDQAFVLERRGRIVVGSPCSGHGFKFAPAIGRRLAELAMN